MATATGENHQPVDVTDSPTWRRVNIENTDGMQSVLNHDVFGSYAFRSATRANNTKASPSAIVSNDLIFADSFKGYYSASQSSEAISVQIRAAENWSASNRGSRYMLQGVNTGDTGLSTWLQMEDGNLLLGGATKPSTGKGVVVMKNGTKPHATTPPDCCEMFPADTPDGFSQWYVQNELGKVKRITETEKIVDTQFDKTSSTTMSLVSFKTSDTGFSLEAGKSYGFRLFIFTSSNVVGGVKCRMHGFNGLTATRIRYRVRIVDGTTVAAAAIVADLTTATGVTAVTGAVIEIEGSIVVNAAGNLGFIFAQNASNAAASSVLTESKFILEPMGL